MRQSLEKAHAHYHATKRRPTVWISQEFYLDPMNSSPSVRAHCYEKRQDYDRVDAIQHYKRVLDLLNENVSVLQAGFESQLQRNVHPPNRHRRDSRTQVAIDFIKDRSSQGFVFMRNLLNMENSKERNNGPSAGSILKKGSDDICNSEHNTVGLLHSDALPAMKAAPELTGDEEVKVQSHKSMEEASLFERREMLGRTSTWDRDEFEYSLRLATPTVDSKDRDVTISSRLSSRSQQGYCDKITHSDKPFAPDNASTSFLQLALQVMGFSMGGLANTARIAGKGALKGVLQATRTLEMLTVGAYYKISSTGFVTFKSRVATSSSLQMLLSHEYFRMRVLPAPNPKDIIWDNVSIPLPQILARTKIANANLVVGAIFWSSVVGFVNRLSNLDILAQDWPLLSKYSDSVAYKLLNQYLPVLVLLSLLALLPFVFDIIARSYEGRKTESEIQNSIMTRYFYYQLANVYVTITVGSLDISQQLFHIVSDPRSLVDILGESLPGVSLYFTSIIIVKIFASLPVELLRIWPLFNILCVKSCMNKKKCTRRDLRTGVFADPPLLYGWIYPNLMMVLMIIVTYASIAPLLMPFGLLYFTFAYLMYKYQLLYVYINNYQSGGYSWYAVFSWSMVALLLGALTLVGYLGLQLQNTFFVGPFYAVIPLPACLLYFWYYCDKKFKTPSMVGSLVLFIIFENSFYCSQNSNMNR